ncbi:MAG: hypothetical protein FJ090_13640 [Deltaproteobacteria bacterium]|nr:hypothetical protein [Deltaproteobacteria bacterium]
MAKPQWVPRGEVLLVAAAMLLAGLHASALRGGGAVPMGADVALWADAALRVRHGLGVTVPPVYPAAAVLLGSPGGIVLGGLAVSFLSAVLVPVGAYAVARALGAGAWARGCSAIAAALSPDLAAHGAYFGPDALAAVLYAAWFGSLVHPAGGGWIPVLTALAVGVREPGLPLACLVAGVGFARPSWIGVSRSRALLVLGGVALSAVLPGRWPVSLAEAFPALHKFLPLLADLACRGDAAYLLDVTAAVPGPLAHLEDAVRAAYASRLDALGAPGRVAFNVLHAAVAHADQLLLAAVGAGGAWWSSRAAGRPERGRLVLALFLPLLGTLLAWSQRRHFLPWLALSWAGVAIALEALLVSRPVMARRLAVAAALLALVPALAIGPRARDWARAREGADAELHALGKQIRLASRDDDFLVVPLGPRLLDPVLLATAERPVISLDQRLRGALRWRAVLLLPDTDPAPEGWGAFAEAPGRRAYRYLPEVTDRECLRGAVRGPLGFGLVPGDNGRGTRVVAGDCAELPVD